MSALNLMFFSSKLHVYDLNVCRSQLPMASVVKFKEQGIITYYLLHYVRAHVSTHIIHFAFML